MNKCPRCGENNPAEVHTCTPGYHFTEHDKLEFIAYKIGYIWDKIFIYNVREIIFTPEFMEKLSDYRDIMQEDKKIVGTKKHQEWQDCFNNILEHLDDPATYLYNLLELGQEKNK